jgi:hypothetical protein
MVRQPDGSVVARWLSDKPDTPKPYEVDVADFYVSAREANRYDVGLFRRAVGLPPLEFDEDFPGQRSKAAVSMSFEEANEYCRWLGDLAGIALRLPSEVEWEFAARSRGQITAFATDDGEFRQGVNVAPHRNDATYKPPGSYPPNPLGIFSIHDGAKDWVTHDGEGRLAKGGSDVSTSFYETIPGRHHVEPVKPEAVQYLDIDTEIARYGTVHLAMAAARCAVTAAGPPATTGYGSRPDPMSLTVPDAIGPYDALGRLME